MSRTLPILSIISIALLASACNQDRFLSGQWVIEQTEALEDLGLDAKALFAFDEGCVGDSCTKWIELNLGHFGAEVVGSLRFFDTKVRKQQTVCTATTRCSCGYVNGRFANDRLNIDYFDCAGNRRTNEIRVLSSDRLEWLLDGGSVFLVPSGRPVTGIDKGCDDDITIGQPGLCPEPTE